MNNFGYMRLERIKLILRTDTKYEDHFLMFAYM